MELTRIKGDLSANICIFLFFLLALLQVSIPFQIRIQISSRNVWLEREKKKSGKSDSTILSIYTFQISALILNIISPGLFPHSNGSSQVIRIISLRRILVTNENNVNLSWFPSRKPHTYLRSLVLEIFQLKYFLFMVRLDFIKKY